jgi:hypothetical protein
MSYTLRRQIPLYLTFIIAFIIILRGFTTEPTISKVATTLLSWSSLIRAISVGLGFIGILFFHIPKITNMSNDPVPFQWFYSLTAVVSMLLFTGLGIFLGVGSREYLWLYSTWYSPIAGLVTAVSAFFAVSAIYRSFRVRNLEALFLVLPALIILLYDAPIGTLLLPGMGPVAEYIYVVIASAAFRGFIAASAVGTLILSIRTIIGQERGYLPEEG